MKMKIIDKPISWNELTNIPSEYIDTKIIFRGVINYDEHDLVPVIGRKRARVDATNPINNLPFNPDEENLMMERFKREAAAHLNKTPESYEPCPDEEWMCIARHHGLPTRLLDWTASPLIAAYFACEKSGIINKTGVDAAIYGLKFENPLTESPYISTGNEDVNIYYSQHLTKRVIAQRGVFTIHHKPEIAFDSDNVIKWKIRSSDCFTIRLLLNKCGFSRATFFPDLDGLSENLGWLYKWGRLDL